MAKRNAVHVRESADRRRKIVLRQALPEASCTCCRRRSPGAVEDGRRAARAFVPSRDRDRECPNRSLRDDHRNLCRSVPHALAWLRRTILTPSCGRCTQATMTALRLTRERHMASAEDHRGWTTSRSSYSGRRRCASRSRRIREMVTPSSRQWGWTQRMELKSQCDRKTGQRRRQHGHCLRCSYHLCAGPETATQFESSGGSIPYSETGKKPFSSGYAIRS
jgi:hypothetical protein